MTRDWNDFPSCYGNIEGARAAFEDACETLFKKKYPKKHVSQVAVNQGDGGIDIFIGELGIEPITVIQCKFFLENFGDSQKSQIRKSFKTTIDSTKYKLKEWILCIPRVLDIDNNLWWCKWKDKQLKEHKAKGISSIKLINGNELINLFKKLDLYNQVFQMEDSHKIAEIYKAVVPKKVIIPKGQNVNTVLFNSYSEENEAFYLERNNDSVFNRTLNISNIWIFGRSGVGKTTLINRNLIQNDIDYCPCDLSAITILKPDDVLSDILLTIEEKFGTQRNIKEINILKQISQILCKQDSKQIVIVIDELSVRDDVVLKEIADNFIQLVTHFNNSSQENELKFVISTILNPKELIQNKSKASEFFQYICCDSWQEYSSQFFDILCQALNLELTQHKSLILEKVNHSPRILKFFLKKIVISQSTNIESIDKALKEILEESV